MGGAPPLPLGSAPADGNQSESSLWFGHSLVPLLGRCSAICGGPGRSPGNVPEHPAGRGPTWPGCPVGTPTRRGSESRRGSEGAPSTPSSYALSRGRVSAVDVLGSRGVGERNRSSTSCDLGTTRVTNGVGGSIGELSGSGREKKNFFYGVAENFSSCREKKNFFSRVAENFSSVVVDVVRNPSSRRV